MTPTAALLALLGLLVVATVAGIVVRRRGARVRHDASGEIVRPAQIGADGLGESATLLQFSTEMCSRCPGVHRLLSEVADSRAGVRHLDVDLTHRPDLAQHFRVLQTPTTLILDAAGAVRTRIGGVPGRDLLRLELDRLTGETTHA